MRQNQPPVAAPLNPNPKWPEGYIEALRNAGAQEKYIPYCLTWVRRFFAANPGRRRRDLGRTEIETYLHNVATRPDVSNWQVQQARNALELYYEQFRGIALAPRPDAPVQAFPSASPLVTSSFARLDQAENKPEQPPVLAPQAQPRHSQGINRSERQDTPQMAEAQPHKAPYKTADQSRKLFSFATTAEVDRSQ